MIFFKFLVYGIYKIKKHKKIKNAKYEKRLALAAEKSRQKLGQNLLDFIDQIPTRLNQTKNSKKDDEKSAQNGTSNGLKRSLTEQLFGNQIFGTESKVS